MTQSAAETKLANRGWDLATGQITRYVWTNQETLYLHFTHFPCPLFHHSSCCISPFSLLTVAAPDDVFTLSSAAAQYEIWGENVAPPAVYPDELSPNILFTVVDENTHKFTFSFTAFPKIQLKFVIYFNGNPVEARWVREKCFHFFLSLFFELFLLNNTKSTRSFFTVSMCDVRSQQTFLDLLRWLTQCALCWSLVLIGPGSVSAAASSLPITRWERDSVTLVYSNTTQVCLISSLLI